jgi:hypothetical protein
MAMSWSGWAQPASAQGPPPPPHWYQTVTPGVTLHHLSPVEYFRGLLGMTEEERERALASRPAEERAAILAKVREYEAMPPEAREARLHQTELRWILMTLIREKPEERAEELKRVSPLDQPMILTELRQWDEVPAETQKALLEKEQFIRTYLEWWRSSPAGQQEILNKLPPGRRGQWEEELKRWGKLPEGQRAELCGQFRHFFALPGEEQKQTMETLSAGERKEMEKTLREFALLPAGERRQCMASFEKFATMAPEERNQFLQNAAKWEAMPARERQLWRRLVGELPPMPPMPPMPPGMPPMPPGFVLNRPVPPPPPTNALAASAGGSK